MWTYLALLAVGLTVIGCSDDATSELGVFKYSMPNDAPACGSDTRSGLTGITEGERTAMGIQFEVRTPANYTPTVVHPLVVVYAPAHRSAGGSARFTGLTKVATTSGFIIAYADHVRNSIPIIEELSTIPLLIAEKWCIDKKRIYLTGHSDGGTAALAIALMDRTKHIPAAIATSAAGFTKADLAEFKCRTPLPVMVMHSSEDTLFPGFGAEAAAWWAGCNQCGRTPGVRTSDGCVTYPNCARGVTTRYCEGTGPHADWPALNLSLIDFFIARIARVGKPVEDPLQNRMALLE